MGKSRKFGARRRREMAQAAFRSGAASAAPPALAVSAGAEDALCSPQFSGPESVSDAGVAEPGIEPSVEPMAGEPGLVCNTLDPFGMAVADDDDAPFDAPDFADEPFGAEPFGPEEEAVPNELPILLDRPVPPPLKPLRPTPASGPSAAEKSLFMEKARQVAQAQRGGRRLPLGELRGPNRIAMLVAAGLAVPALVGVWALQRVEAGPRPAAAAVQVPAPAAPDFATDYEAARALLDAGDAGRAMPLLQRAAEGGVTAAQYDLARRYERGDGIARDAALALAWTQRAAEAGHCRAMHDVGVYLASGESATPDEAGAFRWFMRAAEQGVADSQYNLGVLYQQGRGVQENLTEALFWYLVAARQHDVDAIDRAVEVAAQMPLQDIVQVRTRARAFQPGQAGAAASTACAETG